LALFFVGIENGAEFAARSAVYTTFGLSSSLALLVAYRAIARRGGKRGALGAPLFAVPVFLGISFFLSRISANLIGGVLLTAASIVLCRWHFRNIEDTVIRNRIRLSAAAVLIRAVAAAGVVVLITGAAQLVGEAWTGVLAAFPIVLFPFLVIIHWTYGWPQAQTVIKNYPLGMGSLVAYSVAVAVAYPRLGVMMGTFFAFIVASIYIWGVFYVSEKRATLPPA
jgi:hypothetical protein